MIYVSNILKYKPRTDLENPRVELIWLEVKLRSYDVLLSPAFSKKSGGTLFLVFRGAWCVVRDAWCVARGAWFRVFSGYFVPLTPPTVSVRSF